MMKSSSEKGFQSIILILVISFLWNLVLPGSVAYCEHVFYTNDLEKIVLKKNTAPVLTYKIFKENEDQFSKNIAFIDSNLSDQLRMHKNAENLQEYIALRKVYKEELATSKVPITISGFFNNKTVYYTFVGYIFLALLVFNLLPVKLKDLNKRNVFIWGFLIYVAWMFTSWLRNFVFLSEGRTIYSFVNFELGPISFFLQELRVLGMSLLISLLWHGWLKVNSNTERTYAVRERQISSLNQLTKQAYQITKMISLWQVNSLLIVAAFLPWTFLYWGNIIKLGDARYLIPALVLHCYWVISWLLITSPLILTIRKWRKLKSNMLAIAIASHESFEPNRSIQFIQEINPISNLTFFGTGIATTLSFLLPFKDLLS